MKLGQYDDAIAQYNAALKVDPMANSVRFNLGLAYYKSARPNEAIAQLKRVVASEPDARNAYLVLADCYRQTGQDQELLALLKPREQLFGDDLAYAFLLGTALLQTGDTTEGQKYVDRIFGAGESAEVSPADGDRTSGPAGLSRREDRVAARGGTQSAAVDGALALRPIAAGAWGAGRGRARLQPELGLNSNDFEANLQLGNMRKGAQRFARPRPTWSARRPSGRTI